MIVTKMHIQWLFMSTIACTQICVKAAPLSESNLSEPDNRLYQDNAGETENIKFLIPSKLKVGDVINVTGLTSNKKERLTISLVKPNKENNRPDYDNIPCQINANFTTNILSVNTQSNGHTVTNAEDLLAPSDLFNDQTFTISFTMEAQKISLKVQESNLSNECHLKYDMDDIAYLTLGGDFEKVLELLFLFG